MPHFGTSSTKRLATCHPDIQLVMNEAIKVVPDEMDFSIICGIRPKEEQEQAVEDGYSWIHWPHGKHNVDPDNPRDPEYPTKAHAVDIAPWPIDWEDQARFNKLADVIKQIAEAEGVKLKWGYDLWGKDAPHWQMEI